MKIEIMGRVNSMPKQIVFTKINTAELLNVEMETLGEDQVAIQTMVSTISCGTEKANISGEPSISINSSQNQVIFPRKSGYSSAGIVVAKGEKVTTVDVGDRVVVMEAFHKSVNTVPETSVVKIESEKISFQDAALCYIGVFPMAALRKTRVELGESMLIMGLGILGLMAVQLAKAAGAVPVIAADPVPERRKKALELGADYALDPLEADFAEKVKELTGGVNTAIEVTGLGKGLNQCLDCMAKMGRIALLGCTRNSDFTVDYYHKVHGPGIELLGAHTSARPKYESYPGHFTQRDDVKTILKLCMTGRIVLESMVDEVHTPEECTEVYERLISDRNFPPVVQFDWSKTK